MKPISMLVLLLTVACSSIFLGGCAAQNLSLGEKERIIFFGDSITEQGVKPNGYVTLIRSELKLTHPKVEVIGAGVSGNKVPDLQKRLDKDVLRKKPTVVVIYIGINDVWHYALKGLKGTPKEDFRDGLIDIVDKIQKAKAQVILCTPTVIGEKRHGENPQDLMLQEYSEVIRKIAREKNVVLCDLRKAFLEYMRENNRFNKEKGILTTDRVHLTQVGNALVAETILKKLGI